MLLIALLHQKKAPPTFYHKKWVESKFYRRFFNPLKMEGCAPRVRWANTKIESGHSLWTLGLLPLFWLLWEVNFGEAEGIAQFEGVIE